MLCAIYKFTFTYLCLLSTYLLLMMAMKIVEERSIIVLLQLQVVFTALEHIG